MDAASPYDPLIHGGALRDRADLTFAAILRAFLIVLPVTIAASLLGAGTPTQALLLSLVLAYVIALFFLQQRGHFAFCVHAMVFGMIVFAALVAALFGSVRSSGTVGQVAAITIGGIFLGRRTLILATAVSVASIGVLIGAENAGWLPAPDYRVTASHWVIYSMIVVAVALVLAYMRTLLLEVVGRLGAELDERRRAEAGRHQSEERFRRVFESSPVGMTITRLSDARYLEINRADQATLGYTREEMIGRTTFEMGAWLSEADRNRFVAVLRVERSVRGYRTRMRNRAGELVDCRIWADLIELDGEECVLSSTINVTDQERADRLRRQSEAKYAAVFNSAPDPIVIGRERDAVQLEVNDAWQTITGYSREAVVGSSSLELGIWSDPAQREQALAQIKAQGAVDNVSARFTIASGARIDVLLSGVRVILDGEPCIVWSWREVTQLRRAQDQEQQIRAKFQALFDTSPEGIAVTRWKDAVVIEANAAAEAQIGCTLQDAAGRSALEMGIGASAGDNADIFARLRAEGRMVNRSTRFRRRDGAWLELLLSAVRLTLDGEKCVVWSWRDITEHRRAEEELRSSRRLLEAVIDAIPMSIFAKDVDSNYIMLNKRMAEYFGLPKEELLYRHTLRLPVDSATRHKSFEDDQWVFENLRTLDQPDVLLAGPDGVQYAYHSTKIPLLDSDGKLIGLLGINRDITSDKRAQAALRESEHRYRSLFQALATPVALSRLRDGVIVDVNDAWARDNGIARESAIGQSGPAVGHWSDLEARARIVQQVLAEGRADNHLVRFVRPDGKQRDVKVSCTRIELDGEPHLLWASRDVTERRRNERLLGNIAKGVTVQTGGDFFRTLVLALCRELPADMVFVGEIVGDGSRVRTIACCSDGAIAENFEYALAGTPCALALEKRGTVIHPDGVARKFPQDEGLARRGISGYAGTSLFDAEGRAIGILVALTREPIERKEFFISMLEIFAARGAAEIERARAYDTVRELNVSLERRVQERTAELEAANRHLDSFGYSVAHDLRSPLGAIAGFADLLHDTETAQLSDEGVQMLRQIEMNTGRMNDMLEGLLQFSRLGHKPVVKVPVPMAALANEVVEELRAQGGAQRAEFRLGRLPESPGDPILLRQVWANLLGNAVKYSRTRAPAIVEVGYDPARTAYFVRDNGVGFEMKYAGKLFGVFERLHSTTEFEGTGVGLAIVQRIVQRHGGEVSAEGEPGRGATFSFTLPAGH